MTISKDDATLLSKAGRWLLVTILIGLLLSVVLMVMFDPENTNQQQLFAASASGAKDAGADKIKALLQILHASSTTYLTYLFLLLGVKPSK